MTLVLGPLLLLQGRWVRWRIPVLPEASGARTGEMGGGPRLSVLVIGDSAAAGVGVARQEDALTGQLVSALKPRFKVSWRLMAKTGATTASTLEWLTATDPAPFDVVATSLGVNDVVAAVGLGKWLKDQRRLRQLIRSRFGAHLLVVSGLPPVADFPALPQPLRWYLGRRAQQFDRALANDVRDEGDVRFVPINFEGDVSQMAPDGFHPGFEIYRNWAQKIAAAIT